MKIAYTKIYRKYPDVQKGREGIFLYKKRYITQYIVGQPPNINRDTESSILCNTFVRIYLALMNSDFRHTSYCTFKKLKRVRKS